MSYRPSRMEVNLSNLAHNYTALQQLTGPSCPLFGVVKADAYGHGVLPVVATLRQAGCRRFAVATSDEALFLRESGVDDDVLVMGPVSFSAVEELVRKCIWVAMTNLEIAEKLSAAATKFDLPAVFHLKVDTGMSRIGYFPGEIGQVLNKLLALPGLKLGGLFSHFATADEADRQFMDSQFARFSEVCRFVSTKVDIPIRHICNSAGLLREPAYHLDSCRAGLALYGLWPSPAIAKRVELRQVFEVKTEVALVRQLSAGCGIGYGHRFVTDGPMRIAVLPMGYADGMGRALSMKISVLIGNRRCPQVGNICMDQMMVDVSALPDVQPGDEVVVVGNQGNECIAPEELATARGNTIVYEIPIMFSSRIHRMVVGDEK